MLISVTSFFRDPEAFHALATQVLPAFADRDPETPVRVWVPGCATGEEAYSLAMVLMEQQEASGHNSPMLVFATDVDERALDVARQGIYPASIAADVSARRLEHFFVQLDEHTYQVKKQLRDVVTFAVAGGL